MSIPRTYRVAVRDGTGKFSLWRVCETDMPSFEAARDAVVEAVQASTPSNNPCIALVGIDGGKT